MKNKLLLTLVVVLTVNWAFTQEKTSGLLERSKIEDKYKWDTSDIYENDQAWEEDYKWIEENLSQYEKYKGNLSSSAKTLLGCLALNNEIGERISRVRLYAMLNRDVNVTNEKYQAMWSKYSTLYTKFEVAKSFIQPEIISIPENTIDQLITEEQGLKIYKQYFNSLALKMRHTLSQDKEDIMAKATKLFDNPFSLYSTFVYGDLPFPTIKNDKGEDVKSGRSVRWQAASTQDRDYRKRAHEEYLKTVKVYSATLAKNLNNYIDGRIFNADVRNYENTLEASFARYNIPTKVLDNLIETVKNNLQPFQRWMSMKKKLLKYDDLYIYDTRVSIFPSVDKTYTWEEAEELTLKSIASMGEDYVNDFKKAFDSRWIDVYPSVGKAQGGGYSTGPTLPHPYVKMNWRGSLLDFYTLVHELGHYVHGKKIVEKQPHIYRDYAPFLGEVASTTAENISQAYLIENAKTKAEKLYHIEKYLDNVVLYIYSSTLNAEFEKMIYKIVEEGGSLSTDEMCKLYNELNKTYYGEDVSISELDSYIWIEWLHFYLDYYVYSYATSFTASIKIAESIKEEGGPAMKRFVEFLEAGTSAYPQDVLLKAGVDMTSPEPIRAVVKRMNDLMDELEYLLAN